MTENELRKLLNEVLQGTLSTDQAVSQLKSGPFKNEHMEHMSIDHHRRLRQGMAEVVLAEPKSIEQVMQIAEKLAEQSHPILFTRLLNEQREALSKKYPDGRVNVIGRTFILNAPVQKNSKSNEPFVALFSAGTSDALVLEEAAEVCLAMNTAYEIHSDVGVAGLHRLMQHIELIQNATAIVVVAGMEGALPSVIGGIAEAPVFAVPTSVGYGASFAGLSALLGMLNSCASGVTVSNIDNGFSAAFTACQVVRQIKKHLKIS